MTVHDFLSTSNAFIEDTCVVLTTAYLLTRVGPVSMLVDAASRPNPVNRGVQVGAGVLFGLLASTEVFFPGMRSPYVFHSLILCLAMFLGGWRVALLAMAIVTLFAFLLTGPTAALLTLLTLVATIGVTQLVKVFWATAKLTVIVPLAGLLGQALAFGLRGLAMKWTGWGPMAPIGAASILANPFGLVLIVLVLREAQTRARHERTRIELEQSRVLLVSADLAALRARIRPHFLFNTLSAIAALCSIDPAKAEDSVLGLGRLIRRNLDVDTTSLALLSAELDYVNQYVSIQKLRFGPRIATEFEVEPSTTLARVPAFALQTLVENAFEHGFQGRSGPCKVRITARQSPNYVLFAVQDDGVGMNRAKLLQCVDRSDQPRHGLGIIDRQLRLYFGDSARLRVFGGEDAGVLVAFRVPHQEALEGVREA